MNISVICSGATKNGSTIHPLRADFDDKDMELCMTDRIEPAKQKTLKVKEFKSDETDWTFNCGESVYVFKLQGVSL